MKSDIIKPVIVQLCKAPRLGTVKTRMQPFLSEQQSQQLHMWLAEHSIRSLCTGDNWQCHLWGNQDHAFFQALKSAYRLSWYQQAEGDLGAKLSHISRFYGGRPSLLIGSDCPFIDADLVAKVFSILDADTDLVLIPACDGGYVGLATVEHHPALFDSIEWGSEVVAAQTLERAGQLKLKVRVLAPLADIDRPEDLGLIAPFGAGLDFIPES